MKARALTSGNSAESRYNSHWGPAASAKAMVGGLAVETVVESITIAANGTWACMIQSRQLWSVVDWAGSALYGVFGAVTFRSSLSIPAGLGRQCGPGGADTSQ